MQIRHPGTVGFPFVFCFFNEARRINSKYKFSKFTEQLKVEVKTTCQPDKGHHTKTVNTFIMRHMNRTLTRSVKKLGSSCSLDLAFPLFGTWSGSWLISHLLDWRAPCNEKNYNAALPAQTDTRIYDLQYFSRPSLCCVGVPSSFNTQLYIGSKT